MAERAQTDIWYDPAQLVVVPRGYFEPRDPEEPHVEIAMKLRRVKHLKWRPSLYPVIMVFTFINAQGQVEIAPFRTADLAWSQERFIAAPQVYSAKYLHNLLAVSNATNPTTWAREFDRLANTLLLGATGPADDNTRLQLTRAQVARIRNKQIQRYSIEGDYPDEQTCKICWANPGIQRLNRHGVLHDCHICPPCFQYELRRSMEANHLNPFPGRCCEEGMPYWILEVINLGDRDLILLFRHCMIKKLSMPGIDVPCFHCGEEIEPASWNVPANGQGQCAFCSHSTCLACGEQTHTNGYMGKGRDRPCRSLTIEEEEARLDLWRAADSRGDVSCPQCGFLLQRDGGCTHLWCPQCRHASFDSVCGSAWGVCYCGNILEDMGTVPIEYRVGMKPGLTLWERVQASLDDPIHCMPQFGDENVADRFPLFDPLERYWGRFHWEKEGHNAIPEQRLYFITYVMPRDARDDRLGLHNKEDMLRLLPRRSRWRVRTAHMCLAFNAEHEIGQNFEHRVGNYPGFLEAFDTAEGVLEELFQAGKLDGVPCDTSDLPLDETMGSRAPKSVPNAKAFAFKYPYIEHNLRKTKPGRDILKHIVGMIRQHNSQERGIRLLMKDAATSRRHAADYDSEIASNERIAMQDHFGIHDPRFKPYNAKIVDFPYPPPMYYPSMAEVRKGITGVENAEQQLMRQAIVLDQRKKNTKAWAKGLDEEGGALRAFPTTKPYVPGESDHNFGGNWRQWMQFKEPMEEWHKKVSNR